MRRLSHDPQGIFCYQLAERRPIHGNAVQQLLLFRIQIVYQLRVYPHFQLLYLIGYLMVADCRFVEPYVHFFLLRFWIIYT